MDIRPAKYADIHPLFEAHHAYRSVGKTATYFFAVYEDGRPVAAFAWMPASYGAAAKIAPECPQAVLSLARMVAIPKEQRKLKNIAEALRWQAVYLIDRTRWPILVSWADAGAGHDGGVYRYAGWKETGRSRQPIGRDSEGRRRSINSNGKRSPTVARVGYTNLIRFEHRLCPEGDADGWLARHGWQRIPTGRKQRNGRPQYTYAKVSAGDILRSRSVRRFEPC